MKNVEKNKLIKRCFKFIKGFVFLLFLFLLVNLNNPFKVNTAANDVIKIAIADDESLRFERKIYYGFKEIDKNVVFDSFGMKSAVYSVENGENDVLACQVDDIDKNYNNLIKVPYPISKMNVTVFYLKDFSGKLDTWNDISSYKVGYHYKNLYVENNVLKYANDYIALNDYDNLFENLLNKTLDVVILPLTDMYMENHPKGIIYKSIETLNTYSYVNKAHSYLVPQLEEAYRKLDENGTFDKIKNNNIEASLNEKTLLHVSSYNSDMIWEKNIINGIHSIIDEHQEIIYYNFGLNLKRIPNTEAQFLLLKSQLRSTFIEKSPDVIIVSDDDALQFIKRYHYILFNDTPVVFCGINNFNESKIEGFENVMTGVTEEISFAENVDLILDLYPNTENIYVLNDYTTAGVIWRNTMESIAKDYTDKVNFIYNDNLSMDEILLDVKKYGNETVIICGTFYVDCDGNYFTEKNLSVMLDKVNHRPVFASLEVNVGFGLFGGKVSQSMKQGQLAARMACEILEGKDIKDIKIITDSNLSNEWIFDYEVLKNYGISKHKIKVKHTALNEKLSLYETNKPQFFLIIVGFVFTSTIIFVLIYFYSKERKSKIQKEFDASHDSLTKLWNRSKLEKDFSKFARNDKTGALLLFDIDDFKDINDVYGHYIGDKCLIALSKRISEQLNDSSIFYRVGGDEFIILYYGNVELLTKLCKKLQQIMKLPYVFDDLILHFTISIGIAEFPKYGDTLSDLFQNADLALYQAKREGKNTHYFYESVLREVSTKKEVITQILRKVTQTDEPSIVFQPILNVDGSNIVAFETLMRINSHEIGYITPDEFIPVAESTGLIVPIGLWIFENACNFAKSIIDKGIEDFLISINISAIQFASQNFISDITKLIEKIGIDSKNIELEITESVFASDAKQNILKINTLRELGFTIALDDFGTGYSSFKYLVDLPLDILKIDKAFIDLIVFDEKTRTITKMLIDTAHTLNLKVVAEGVEEENQVKVLKDIKCDYIQGYIYSKPLKDVDAKNFIYKKRNIND